MQNLGTHSSPSWQYRADRPFVPLARNHDFISRWIVQVRGRTG